MKAPKPTEGWKPGLCCTVSGVQRRTDTGGLDKYNAPPPPPPPYDGDGGGGGGGRVESALNSPPTCTCLKSPPVTGRSRPVSRAGYPPCPLSLSLSLSNIPVTTTRHTADMDRSARLRDVNINCQAGYESSAPEDISSAVLCPVLWWD